MADQQTPNSMHGAPLFPDAQEAEVQDWGPEVYPKRDDENDAPDAAPSAAPEVAELRGQITALTKQIEMMQMASQAQPSTPQYQPAPQFQPEELPDPYEDPKGYAETVERNIRKKIEFEQRQAAEIHTRQQSETAKYQELWEDFQIRHKDVAVDENGKPALDRVQFAANKVAQRALRQGLDLNRYMFTHRERFMADVAAEMETIFGKRQAPSKEDNIIRTDGIFGARPGKGSNTPKDEEPMDPWGDIREFQLKSGFYR